jgi:XisI protein
MPERSADGSEFQLVFDDDHGRYQIVALGWIDGKYIVDVVVYLELRGNLIWLHADNTDWGVGEELLSQGVLKESIVIGWLTPFMRQHSGFATGEAA